MNVLYLCNFDLPLSCANATRVLALAKMHPTSDDVKLIGLRYHESKEDLCGKYEGIPYENLYIEEDHPLKRRKKLGKLLLKRLQEIVTKDGLDIIIFSNFYSDYSKVLYPFLKKYKISTVTNQVEWYQYNREYYGGVIGKIKFIRNRFALRVLSVKLKNLICISTVLSNYYKKRRCNVIQMPTLIDMCEYENLSHKKNDRMVISYAGNMERKDYMGNLFLGLSLLNEEERSRLKVNIFGTGFEKYKFHSSHKETGIESVVKFYGKIPYCEVKNNIVNSDFTILLRPNLKYANAGFPTKVGESMACGTPVIANITSDLGKCIIDGKTGIVCEDESPTACAQAIRKALNMKSSELEQMRQEAKQMAYRYFDISTYRSRYMTYLNKILNER